MKDEGFVPRAWPDTFILHPSCFLLSFQGILRTVVTAEETTPEAVGANSRWSSASRDTRVIEQLVAARTPPDRRIPLMFQSRRDWGFVEPGSVRLHHPYEGGFLDRYGTGGVRAATFFATTPVSRKALDHRLLAPPASGVALCTDVSACGPSPPDECP